MGAFEVKLTCKDVDDNNMRNVAVLHVEWYAGEKYAPACQDHLYHAESQGDDVLAPANPGEAIFPGWVWNAGNVDGYEYRPCHGGEYSEYKDKSAQESNVEVCVEPIFADLSARDVEISFAMPG